LRFSRVPCEAAAGCNGSHTKHAGYNGSDTSARVSPPRSRFASSQDRFGFEYVPRDVPSPIRAFELRQMRTADTGKKEGRLTRSLRGGCHYSTRNPPAGVTIAREFTTLSSAMTRLCSVELAARQRRAFSRAHSSGIPALRRPSYSRSRCVR
jgi:hypothetical protein